MRWAKRVNVAVMLVLLLPVLAACGGQDRSEPIRWEPYEPVAQAPTGTPSASSSPIANLADVPLHRLTPDELQKYQPNELGVIPVFEYHAFVTNESGIDQFTTTIDRFTKQLQWLYDHDFYIISMESFISDMVTAPPGKHPVVLTFDDSSPGQFRLVKGSEGSLVPDPLSAIGAMEAFVKAHPDFGRGGFFAVLSFNCFAMPAEPDQMPYCDQKLKWLSEHGYEVGNHTLGHQDLYDISDDAFAEQLGGAALWARGHIPATGNLDDVVAIPFGDYPDADIHQEQRRMLRDGFTYQGQEIRIRAALMVGANPSVSPTSVVWDPIFIPRIQTYDEEIGHWFQVFEDAGVILYVSDGDPNTITVPDPLPSQVDGELDPDVIASKGKRLVQYDPSQGA